MHGTFDDRSPMAMDAHLESQMQDLGRTQLALLDLIDDIQAAQIQTDNLPQIAVVGDQSSGKSSALEIITGVPFPRASGACTKYATEIRLRRSITPGFKVWILPDSSRSAASQAKLRNFGETIGSETSFEQLFHLAKEAITAESTKWASDDKLIVEKSGPDQPLLTLVDLPGIISIANENQSLEDKAAIESLTDRYMSNPSTLILAVVGASTDYAVAAKILEKTRQHDREGSRTIGVLTKPDLAQRDGHTEGCLRLVTNNDRVNSLALGWNVLLNPPHNESWPTVPIREQKEREFFSQDGWKNLDPSMCGASPLRSKLSVQLQRQIATHLPALREELSKRLEGKLKSQAGLGKGYDSVPAMREGITEFLNTSSMLADRAVNGTYINLDGDDFFDHEPDPMNPPPEKIRARVVKANYTFAHNLRKEGHSEGFISASGPFHDSRSNNTEPKKKNYARDKVTKMIEQNVGTHLPGHQPHSIPYQLFQMHSKKWKDMALAHTVKIKNICNQFMNEVLTRVWPTELQEPLRRHVTMLTLERIHQDADNELRTLVADLQYEVQLYDPDFTDRLAKWYEARDPNPGDDSHDQTSTTAERLLEESLILYDIIGRNFIRDIAVKVVERHFIQGIREIFNSKLLYSMDDAVIETIAGEDAQTTELRFRLKADIENLKAAIAKIDNLPRPLATSSYGEDDRENGWGAQNNSISGRQTLKPPPGGLSSYSDNPPKPVNRALSVQARQFEYHEFSRTLTGQPSQPPPKNRFIPPPNRDIQVPEEQNPPSKQFSDHAEGSQFLPQLNYQLPRVSNESDTPNGINGFSNPEKYNKHHSVPTRPPPGIPGSEMREARGHGHGHSNSTPAAATERMGLPHENGLANGYDQPWLPSVDLSHPFTNGVQLEDTVSMESDQQSQLSKSSRRKPVNGFSKLIHHG